ncbi:MAG: T9SS type A sorting domain-containing protein [Bacteroidales bacterium]|jgi:hypothetical protein|nr:T9SS type A sorting domain-containing protein [Bacteroidales bacterium]
MKQKITLLAMGLMLSFGLFAQETLITLWTFDGLAASPNTPLVIPCNTDAGELTSANIYADGSNGSSTFASTEITSYTGYAVNDPRTTPVSGKALGFITTATNGKSLVFKFSTTGYANIVMTFAVRGTATGYNSHVWAYSTNGTDFTPFETENTAHNAGGSDPVIRTLDFSSITAINDQPYVYIKLTISGATNDSGTNRFDNFQIKGTASGPDLYPPRLTGYEMLSATSLKLTFNEAINQTIAETASNYTLAESYNVTTVSLSDSRFVTLTIDPALTEGNSYTLTIHNMQDVSENENVMADSTFTFTYGVSTEYHKATIAALRAAAPEYNGGINNSSVIYKFSGEAIITYIITNRNQKYIQDNTGAMLIDDLSAVMGSGFEVGDKVAGIYGTLSNYYGLVQFVPTEAGTTVGWNEEVEPELVDVTDFDSLNTNGLQSKLVKVDNVNFTASGNFATGTYYDLMQNGTTYPAVVFTNNWNADYIDAAIPTYTVALTGVVTYTYNQNRLIVLDQSSMTSLNSYNASTIKLAPNPATNFVNIETGEAMQLEIYSLTGQLAATDLLNAGTNLISIASLNAGMYIIKLTEMSSGKSHTSRLVVQ